MAGLLVPARSAMAETNRAGVAGLGEQFDGRLQHRAVDPGITGSAKIYSSLRNSE